MPEYTCPKCNRVFDRKSGYDDHVSKKIDCGGSYPITESDFDAFVNTRMSVDDIADQRDIVDCDYRSAESRNRMNKRSGDPKATDEYIYASQRDDAQKIIHQFFSENKRVVTVSKKTKVGADGLMIEIARLAATHNIDEKIVNLQNIRFITGMSSIAWSDDFKNKVPACFNDKIFHHGQLKKVNLSNVRNALIIIDEIDTGDKEYQVLHSVLKEAGVLDVSNMQENNNRFVFISATITRPLYEVDKWPIEIRWHMKMTIPQEYIGHMELVNRGIIQEFYPLDTDELAGKWVKEDIVNKYGTDYRIHFVRVNPKSAITLKDACIRHGVDFRHHTSVDRISEVDLRKLFESKLEKHIVLSMRGFMRRAYLIPNAWKIRIGATHELYTKIVDASVQIQGFPGRLTGYWRSILDNQHRTGPYRTSIKAIQNYEKMFENPSDPTAVYKTDHFSKIRKHVKVQPTMLSPKHVGLNVVEDENTRDTGVCSPISFNTVLDAKRWAKETLVWINPDTNDPIKKNVSETGLRDAEGNLGGNTHLLPSARKVIEEIKTITEFRNYGDFGRFGGGVRCVPVYTNNEKTSISYVIVYKKSMNPPVQAS